MRKKPELNDPLKNNGCEADKLSFSEKQHTVSGARAPRKHELNDPLRNNGCEADKLPFSEKLHTVSGARAPRKPEFSKLVLGAAVLMWFAGAVFAAVIVCEEREQLREFLAYIGAPASTAFGFYFWKAKNENIIKYNKQQLEKLKQVNNNETEVRNDAMG